MKASDLPAEGLSMTAMGQKPSNPKRHPIGIALAAGAGVFLMVHVVLMLTWKRLFQWQFVDQAWWMNSWNSNGFMLVVLSLTALVLSAIPDRSAPLSAVGMFLGAEVMMTVILFLIGPGNLDLLVITIGTFEIASAVFLGACSGAILKRLLPRRPAE